jgi:hypothetical protein
VLVVSSVGESPVATPEGTLAAPSRTLVPEGSFPILILGGIGARQAVAPGDCPSLPSAFLREFCQRAVERDWRNIARGVEPGPNPPWYAALARANFANDATICADHRLTRWLFIRAIETGGATDFDAAPGCRLVWLVGGVGWSVSDPEGNTILVGPGAQPLLGPPVAVLSTANGVSIEGAAEAADDREPAIARTGGYMTITLSDGAIISRAEVKAERAGAATQLLTQHDDASPSSITFDTPPDGDWQLQAVIDVVDGRTTRATWAIAVRGYVGMPGGPPYPVECRTYRPVGGDWCSAAVNVAETVLPAGHLQITSALVRRYPLAGGGLCSASPCPTLPDEIVVRFDFVDRSSHFVLVNDDRAQISPVQPSDPAIRPNLVGDVRTCPPPIVRSVSTGRIVGSLAECTPLPGSVALVLDERGHVVRRLQGDKNGQLSARLPVGHYRLQAVHPIVPIGLSEPVDVDVQDPGVDFEPVGLSFIWPTD